MLVWCKHIIYPPSSSSSSSWSRLSSVVIFRRNQKGWIDSCMLYALHYATSREKAISIFTSIPPTNHHHHHFIHNSALRISIIGAGPWISILSQKKKGAQTRDRRRFFFEEKGRALFMEKHYVNLYVWIWSGVYLLTFKILALPPHCNHYDHEHF